MWEEAKECMTSGTPFSAPTWSKHLSVWLSGERSYPDTRITTMKLLRDLLGDLADVLFRGIGALVCLLAILIIARVAF